MTSHKDSLLSSVDKLKSHKVMVVGDVGLDEYVIGQVRRISPEAPVPVLEVNNEDLRLGLAGNVAANIAGLGGVPILVGVVGDDAGSDKFKTLLQRNQCSSEYLVEDSTRPTTRKLRVMAGQHHIVRVDFEKKKFLSPEVEEKILHVVKTQMPNCSAVILQDYAKGVLSEKLVQNVIRLAHENKKIVTLDPNRTSPVDLYKGVDYLTPNTDEALALSELKLDDLRSPSDSLQEVGEILLKKLNAQAVVITRGKDGMSAFSKNGNKSGQHIPTYARSVFDVTGAGDTVIASFTLALSAGLNLEEACVLANYAAGVVVGKIGCVSTNPQELKSYIQEHYKS